MESVRAQNGPGIEVEHVIVDSGSVDDTVVLAKEHGCRVEHVPPIGIYHSINAGIAVAAGDVMCIIGGDDTLLPGAAGTVAAWHSARRHDWLVGSIKWTDATGRNMGILRPPPPWMTQRAYVSLGWSCIQTQSTFLTRRFLARLGSFSEDYAFAGDYEFFARALGIEPFDRTPAVLATYRRHGANLSMSPEATRTMEDQRIASEFGPKSVVKPIALKYTLKFWINAANPGWFLYKKLPGLMARARGRVSGTGLSS